MASNKTPTQRLDAMSKFFFDEGGIVDQIKTLQDNMLPTDAECDAISAQLGALYDKYSPVRDTARETRNLLSEINDELRAIKETMAPIAAQARLDAFGLNPKTAKPYTASQIKDRALIALASNEGYQKLDPGAAGLAVMEAQARFDAGGFDETTAKPYTVEQTKDRATVALAANEEYQKIVERRGVLEREKAGAQAILADCDAALSEYRNRNRALCAQLGMQTARLGK